MKQKQTDPVADDKWIVELWNENERSFHGHTVIAITGPIDGRQRWTQTYDFLGGERYKEGDPTSLQYTPLEPNSAKQSMHVSGYDAGRGFPDVVLSSKTGVGYRQIGASEAISGRRNSIGPDKFNYQVPGFVRYRAPMGHTDGAMLYGKAVSLARWTVDPDKGQQLQAAIAASAQNPPPYAASWSLQDLTDPNFRSTETCHSWAKDMVTKIGLDIPLGVSGPAPQVELNYFCYACGLVLVGGLIYLVGRSR